MKPLVTAELIRNFFDYDEVTGDVRWKVRLSNRTQVGDLVDRETAGGYKQVSINRKHYYVHRIIWVHKTGQWPEGDIDHINGDTRDNRWINLRCVTRSVNNHNRLKDTGVTFSTRNKKWMATIVTEGNSKYIGAFSSKEKAIAAYQAEKSKLSPRLQMKLEGQQHETI